MTTKFTDEEQQILLHTARAAIKAKLENIPHPLPDLIDLPQRLRENGACFITLTKNRVLRGCVGSIFAVQPLILDVQDRALAAAFQDYRFPQLTREELDEIKIEISCLTAPVKLNYLSPEDLPDLLHPFIDGVILYYQGRRATFLPQVWEKLTSPDLFLNRLCLKMGLDQSLWREQILTVEVYQVVKFEEVD